MQNIFKQEYPKGLYLLFFVEMWERFSYYGMRALLVLYMIQELLFSSQKAGNIYGIYTGLVYLTPLIGGYLADRFFGQRKCIMAGAVLSASGLFVLAFGGKELFLLSLFLMICANGCFKSNISSVVGLLFGDNDSKKDSAFTIFYMGINLGAFLSPLVCGTLAAKYGFEWGFASAGVGMLIGLVTYKLFEHKLLGDVGSKPVCAKQENNISTDSTNKSKFIGLFVLMLFTIPFWICFEQAGSSLTLFAEYKVNREFFGFHIHTGYFQSLNPLFIILLAPLTSALWSWLNKRGKEPTSIEKFSAALFLMSVSFVIMIVAGLLSDAGKISPLWLILTYFVMTVAELCLSPIGLSLVSKLAPKKFLSLTMGCWFIMCFLGDAIAGFWGGKYETLTPTQLFAPLAAMSFAAFLLLVILTPKLNKTLKL